MHVVFLFYFTKIEEHQKIQYKNKLGVAQQPVEQASED